MSSDRKRLIFTAIVISLAGMAAGLFLAGGFLPSEGAQELGQYDEKTTTSKTVRVVVHAHDGYPEHKHVATLITAITEETPHGGFHDFAATVAQTVPPSPIATASTPAPTVTTPTPTVTIPTQGVDEIWISSREFRPNFLTVPVGTRVTWINKDFEGHNVVGDTGLFNGSPGPGGGSFSHTFTAAGNFTYHCELHSAMTGTIIVK